MADYVYTFEFIISLILFFKKNE